MMMKPCHCIENDSTVAKLGISQPFVKGAMTNDFAVPVITKYRINPYSKEHAVTAFFEFRKVEEMPGFIDTVFFDPAMVNDASYVIPHTAPERDSVTVIVGGVSYVATQRVLFDVIVSLSGVKPRGLRQQMRRDSPTLGTGLWFCDVAPCDVDKMLAIHHSALMHHDRVTIFKPRCAGILKAWTAARDDYCKQQNLVDRRAPHPLVVEIGKPTRVRGRGNNRR